MKEMWNEEKHRKNMSKKKVNRLDVDVVGKEFERDLIFPDSNIPRASPSPLIFFPCSSARITNPVQYNLDFDATTSRSALPTLPSAFPIFQVSTHQNSHPVPSKIPLRINTICSHSSRFAHSFSFCFLFVLENPSSAILDLAKMTCWRSVQNFSFSRFTFTVTSIQSAPENPALFCSLRSRLW